MFCQKKKKELRQLWLFSPSRVVQMTKEGKSDVNQDLFGHKTIEECSQVDSLFFTNEQVDHHGGNTMGEIRKVKVNGTEYEVELEFNGEAWEVTVEGSTFTIEMPGVSAAPKAKRSASGGRKKSGTVSANIPGKVVTVEVKEGQKVKEGQVVLILEAMKMQNEIQAPISGTVVSVQCQEGDAIEANVPLLVIEPDEEAE